MPGTHFRAPLSVKLLDGTSIEIVDSTGVVVAALGDGVSITSDTLVATDKKLEFRATTEYINSPSAGVVQIVAGTGLTVATDATFSNGKQLIPDGAAATASSGAATVDKQSGLVTSEALTSAAAATYTLTLTNALVAATSTVLVSVGNGSNTQGQPTLETVTPGSGSVVIVVRNRHASQALNGTLVIGFLVLNPA
jgi:hypothetical protein